MFLKWWTCCDWYVRGLKLKDIIHPLSVTCSTFYDFAASSKLQGTFVWQNDDCQLSCSHLRPLSQVQNEGDLWEHVGNTKGGWSFLQHIEVWGCSIQSWQKKTTAQSSGTPKNFSLRWWLKILVWHTEFWGGGKNHIETYYACPC